MSWRPTTEPQETPVPEPVEPDVEAVLTPRDRDLGGFVVRRLLPASQHRTVGPFVFFDHFGPTGLAPGQGGIDRDPLRWSRTATCYQLKSAMGWCDLHEATGEGRFLEPYERVLENSLRTYADFLPGHPDRPKVMDRLHAFCYFLEGLLPRVPSAGLLFEF